MDGGKMSERRDEAGPSNREEGISRTLPLNTRVLVVGNKRTRQSLTGQQGVVVDTVDLGGWHWLRLDSGEKVKVQRNGLQVIEMGDGRLVEGDAARVGFTTASGGRKRSTGARPEVLGRSVRRRKSEPSQQRSWKTAGGVDLNKLDNRALRRYLAAFDISFPTNALRSTLLARVWQHFNRHNVDEWDVVRNLSIKRDALNDGGP